MDIDGTECPAAPVSRHSHVDAFLATLSPWDLLYLCRGFRTGKINITGLATMSDLPLEILSLIATQLELEDLVNCRFVSRSWHAMWTHGGISAVLCDHFFPGLLEKHALERDARRPDVLLRSAIIGHHVPPRSTYILWNRSPSATVSTASATEHGPGAESDEVLRFRSEGPLAFYDGGLFAWQAGSASVIVDDLWTCQRWVCSFVESIVVGDRMRLQGMSRRLLVFATSSGGSAGLNYNMLRIWHIQSGAWKHVTLPGPFARGYVEGERVAVVTRQGLIIKWSWGGSAGELDQSGFLSRVPEGYESGLSLPGVILHPGEQNVTYIARIYRSKPQSAVTTPHAQGHSQKYRYLMSVVRYDDVMSTRRWQELIKQDSLRGDASDDSLYGTFRLTLLCPKMSSNGLYGMGAVLTACDDVDEPRAVEFATTGFNVYKEAFLQRRFEYAGRGKHQARFDPAKFGSSKHEECLTTWSRDHIMIPRYSNGTTSGRDEQTESCRIYEDQDFCLVVGNHGLRVLSYSTNTQLPAGSTTLTTKAALHAVDPTYPADIKPLAG